MDKQSYSDAMATVIAADKDTLTQAVAVVDAFESAHEDACTKLQAILDGFGDLSGPVVGARSTIQNLVAQLALMEFTADNMVTVAGAALAQYTPSHAPAPATDATASQ